MSYSSNISDLGSLVIITNNNNGKCEILGDVPKCDVET